MKVSSLNEGAGTFFNQEGAGDSNANNAAPPSSTGGMGRRGTGGGVHSGGTYSSGGGSPSKNSTSAPTVVTIQWQSALAVRMAEAERPSSKTFLAQRNGISE